MKDERDPFKRKRPTRDIDDFFRDFWTNPSQGTSNDFYSAFEEHMKRIQELMNKKIKQSANQEGQGKDSSGPWIYGWTYSTGSDREPTFQEFSNIPRDHHEQSLQITDRPEPYIDIQEEEKEVYVTIEIPGVEKKDIDLTVQNETLTIDINHEQRGFHKTIDLPAPVRENKSQASYNNGILHITLQKTKQKNKGNNIKIN
jgi:HSP20 family protein